MNQFSRRARSVACTLIAGTLAWVAEPSSRLLAQQDSAAAANAPGAAPAEPASESRRERRRAAQAESAAAPASPATAAVVTPTAAAAPSAPTADGPTTICKNIKPLGTRMAKRVCGTPEQWAALEKKTTDAASDDLRRVRGTGAVIATTPGPTATP